MSSDLSAKFCQNNAQFTVDFYNKLSAENVGKNLIFSPFSIQTCVALAYIGAKGTTADEMATGLKLVANDRTLVAKSFKGALDTFTSSSLLKVANKVYVKLGYEINPEFNQIAKDSFQSSSQEIDFCANEAAANTINSWVEEKTNNKIKKLISPACLDDTTRLVLVNAIHFQGEWTTKFKATATAKEDFFLNDKDTVKVDMMNGQADYNYGYFQDLDCSALQMPYKNSDLSMLVLLPNSRTGLDQLEDKLKNINLFDLAKRMRMEDVIVKFPKFKAEFSADLEKPLNQLGITRMFTDCAEFDNLLISPEDLKVSKVIHKAFIKVDEEGAEAAAATAVFMCGCTSVSFQKPMPKIFTANKPFLYVIWNNNGIYFAGRNLKI